MRTLIVTAAAALLVAGTAFAQSSPGTKSDTSPSMLRGSSGSSDTMSPSKDRMSHSNKQQSQVPSKRSKHEGGSTMSPSGGGSMGNSSKSKGSSGDDMSK